jgi:hypothetical protein
MGPGVMRQRGRFQPQLAECRMNADCLDTYSITSSASAISLSGTVSPKTMVPLRVAGNEGRRDNRMSRTGPAQEWREENSSEAAAEISIGADPRASSTRLYSLERRRGDML